MTTRTVSRRQFMGQASCAAVGSTALFSGLMNLGMTNVAAAQGLNSTPYLAGQEEDYKALVCVLLAGGNDSFNMLVPRTDSEYADYQAIRSDLAIAKDTLLPLNVTGGDGREYGVHPGMPEVQQLFNDGNLAFVANVGTLVEPTDKNGYESGVAKLPLGLYSHSDQIMHWQTSVPDKRSAYGWAGRMADVMNNLNTSNNISMNISLSGSNIFQAGSTVAEYSIGPNGAPSLGGYGTGQGEEQEWYADDPFIQLRTAAIDSMLDLQYRNLFEQTFINTTRNSLSAYQEFNAAVAGVQPLTTQFSPGYLSKNMEMIAKTIAARQTLGMKRQTFFVLFGGWDHHDEVINAQGAMLPVVSKALSEFHAALTELGVADKVTTFTTSDFGRTLTSNGRGSDHGWGGNQIVMGGAVQGGQLYGNYPNLRQDGPLDVGRGNLIPTTSVDEYFSELALWFGVDKSDLSTIFPNIDRFYTTSSETMPLGVLPRAVETVSLNPVQSPTQSKPVNTNQQPFRSFLPFVTRG
ncbi:MAG: DUF1501 domain-containing protein [Chloroflexota bacterium]